MLYTYHTSVIHLYGFIMFTKCLSVKILEHVYESEENKWKYCREVVDKLPTETDEWRYQGQQIFLGTSPNMQNSLLVGAILNRSKTVLLQNQFH